MFRLIALTGRMNVILVDALNSTLLNQMNVREEMFKLLLKLPQGRPVAIYALGEKLQLLQDFTSDPKILRDAITNYKDHAPQQLKNPVGDPISQAFILSTLPSASWLPGLPEVYPGRGVRRG